MSAILITLAATLILLAARRLGRRGARPLRRARAGPGARLGPRHRHRRQGGVGAEHELRARCDPDVHLHGRAALPIRDHEHGLPAGGDRGDRNSGRAAAGQHRRLHHLRRVLGLQRRLGRHHRLGRLPRDRQARLQQADRARLDRRRRHARHPHTAEHHLHRLRQPGRGLDRQAVPRRRHARPGALGALFDLYRRPLHRRPDAGAAATPRRLDRARAGCVRPVADGPADRGRARRHLRRHRQSDRGCRARRQPGDCDLAHLAQVHVLRGYGAPASPPCGRRA